MTPLELFDKCTAVLESGHDRITLVVANAPKGFPRGELLCEGKHGAVLSYDAAKIIKWLAKVTYEYESRRIN